jgi:hypothetical protein
LGFLGFGSLGLFWSFKVHLNLLFFLSICWWCQKLPMLKFANSCPKTVLIIFSQLPYFMYYVLLQLQKDHKPRSFAVLQSGLVAAATEAPEEVLEQRLHDIATQREQLQQAEVELRACFIARSEVIQMQNTFDEQSKQHSHIVVDLQVFSSFWNKIMLPEKQYHFQALHLHIFTSR